MPTRISRKPSRFSIFALCDIFVQTPQPDFASLPIIGTLNRWWVENALGGFQLCATANAKMKGTSISKEPCLD